MPGMTSNRADDLTPPSQFPQRLSVPHPAQTIVLRDHRHVLVRPVQPLDRDALAAAYLQLSSDTQQSRFGSAPRILGQAALRQLVDSVDGVDHVAFAAFAQHDPGRLVGVARILRYPDDPESLDIGVTVADDYQGSGLGSIFAALLAKHRPRPARRVITEVNERNIPALSLLAAFGSPQRSKDGRVFIDLTDDGAD
jgi:RimJ/RimL family protein N-acetyltransferase